MPVSLARATKIIIPSEATKVDLQHFYNVPDTKIHIIPDGFQDILHFKDEASSIAPLAEPFFFFAGRVKLRKNVHAIVAAFIDFKLRTKAACKLVIAGGYGGAYYQDMVNALREAHIEHDVSFVGYVTGPQLYSYYKHTLALVYPSLHEGFGMPLVEAMSLGTPIITSNISSMPEVVGDAGLLIDPYDFRDIGNAMEKIYFDPALRAELRQKGLHRATLFSWKESSQKLLAVLETLNDNVS
jgi:glycosyltransferase involved in cell wall biosynthesis